MFKNEKTRIQVKGLNQERIINSIIKDYKIYNFSRKNHQLSEFEIDFIHHKKLIKILKDSGLEVKTLLHRGLISKLKTNLTRFGIISALVICFLVYLLQYSFILKIDIYGINKETSKEIETFLNNTLQSRNKSKIDTKNLEFMIKENFEEVSSVSVAFVGQSLVININETVLPEELKEGQPIVSQFDGLITKINLIQGTLAVNEGDLVKKGDILVYPYIIDSEGEECSILPQAEIFADIWLNESETFYEYLIKNERTGNKVVKNEVYINNLLLYSNRIENQFSDYEIEESKKCISKNNILPIYKKTTVYYETVAIEIKENFEDAKDRIIEKARQKTLIFLQENEIIKEENYNIRESGGIYQIDYLITVNRNIGGVNGDQL